MVEFLEKHLGKWASRRFVVWLIGTALFVAGPLVGVAWLTSLEWLGLSGIYMGTRAAMEYSSALIEKLKGNKEEEEEYEEE
tara:strand:- start:1368 stop:1610 length:243 start_codon:yes stop_codon:yes gene_type:complete